ncbi:MAG: stalk domain-containing protein [bacterium]|nr:stalk domain-containing protein [bacterium]
MNYNRIFAEAVVLMMSVQTASAYDGPQIITVHNTENHGVYVTVGGTHVYCEETELPFIDENGRTQVPVRAVSEAMGKKVSWNETEKSVGIKDSVNDVGFVIDSAVMTKNGAVTEMDTAARIVDGHTYIPLRFLGEALGSEVEYTTEDRFSDIVVTRIFDNEDFDNRESVTVWGNIQDIFHESGGLGSMKPYDGSLSDLDLSGVTQLYEISFSDKTVSVYWDYVEGEAYALDENKLYTVDTGFARFLSSLFEDKNKAAYSVGNEEKQLFKENGWTLDYKMNTVRDTLPQMTELGTFDSKYYYTYNNELSKDVGLDMSSYAGSEITADIYYIHESMPPEFYPTEKARGIVIKCNGEIIGAYISSGRHRADAACSLKGRSFEEITGTDYGTYCEKLLLEEADAVKDNPEEVIRKYFDALAEKNEEKAVSCLSKQEQFVFMTTNMPDTKLYNTSVWMPLTNKTFADDNERRIDNIKSVGNIKITAREDEDKNDNAAEFEVEFDIEYKNDESMSSGSQWMICKVVYESDKTGWKIVSFGY